MPVSQADAAYIRDLVHKRSAIVIDAAKDYLIETRLDALTRDLGLSGGIGELIGQARSGHRGIDVRIVEAITTHETSFFRDIMPFDVLKREFLPKIIDARQKTRTLTVWSAACSTGQEPYSLAMLLLDSFPNLATWTVRIIATDISTQVLARAREARFSQLEVNRGLPANYLTKFFERDGIHWTARAEVRRMIEFRQLNLIDRWAILPRPDVVFLRNVLIYFDVATKKVILDRVRQNIAADGALFLGSAETTLNVTDGWDRVVTEKTTYYRVGQ